MQNTIGGPPLLQLCATVVGESVCDDGDFGINSDDTRGGGGDDSGENGGGDGSTVDGNGYGDAYLIQANIRPGTVCLQTRYQQATK